MSNDDVTSDDEFQDAISDVTNTVPNESTNDAISNNDAIEELVNKQFGLSLNDDDGQADDDEAAGENDENDEVGFVEEDIDEDELLESEKLLSPAQLERNKEKADKLKLEGNELFKNNNAEQAVIIYTEALKICPSKYNKERAIMYGNRAAAKIKLELKKSAVDDCSLAIKLWPDYVRARLRRAKLYEYQDKLDLALDDYKRVYELDPGQPEAREAVVRLPPIVNERNEKLKAEMIDKLKDLGDMVLKPFGLSTSNFQMQQDPNTGSYSINFNQNSG